MKKKVMKNPLEIFTYPPSNKSKEANDALKKSFCRYINGECTKESRLINYPMGICSVNNNSNKPIICPKRFLEDGKIFKKACTEVFGTCNNVLLFKEVKLKNVGTFDFVLVQHEPFSCNIVDFCILEIQSDSTTGTGKLVKALAEFKKDGKVGDSYNFGLNTYNSIKLSYIQMLIKGKVMEQWRKKIIWVMQDCVFENMIDRFQLNNMDFDKKQSTYYHIYQLNKSKEVYSLKFKKKHSTTIDNLLTAFSHLPPDLPEFINELQNKMKLKLGLKI